MTPKPPTDIDALIERRWKIGDLVQKKRGSQWRGHVVGFYSTDVTEEGYAVESAYEIGSVQVWPEVALEDWEGRPAATALATLRAQAEAMAELLGELSEGPLTLFLNSDWLGRLDAALAAYRAGGD